MFVEVTREKLVELLNFWVKLYTFFSKVPSATNQ